VGPAYPDAETKLSRSCLETVAKAAKVAEINDKGDTIQRDGRPTDPIVLTPLPKP